MKKNPVFFYDSVKIILVSLDTLWQSVYLKITSFFVRCVGIYLPMCWKRFCVFKVLVLWKKNVFLWKNINMLPLSDILAVHILCPSNSQWELSLLFNVAVLVLLRVPYTNEWFINTTEQVWGDSLVSGKFWGCTERKSYKVTSLLQLTALSFYYCLV